MKIIKNQEIKIGNQKYLNKRQIIQDGNIKETPYCQWCV